MEMKWAESEPGNKERVPSSGDWMEVHVGKERWGGILFSRQLPCIRKFGAKSSANCPCSPLYRYVLCGALLLSKPRPSQVQYRTQGYWAGPFQTGFGSFIVKKVLSNYRNNFIRPMSEPEIVTLTVRTGQCFGSGFVFIDPDPALIFQSWSGIQSTKETKFSKAKTKISGEIFFNPKSRYFIFVFNQSSSFFSLKENFYLVSFLKNKWKS